MKLSEVSIFLDFLRNADINPAWIDYTNKLHSVRTMVVDNSLQIGTVSYDLVTAMDSVIRHHQEFEKTVSYLQAQLEQIIVQREPEYYQNSLRLYEDEMRWETTEYILNRRLLIDAESDELIRNRIKNYSDWRLPGMIIRPGRETHIEDLVPLDPLYVVDQHMDLITPAIEKFTIEYQRRLRPYVINDYENQHPLEDLPNEQFGFIFAYNFLNYKPIEVIERYLKEFYQKLRPGGAVLFTYNNCDLPQGMGLAEQHFMCYTPGHKVRDLADQIGFENTYNQQGPNNLSWLELKKPGEITSLRGGQTLARIARK